MQLQADEYAPVEGALQAREVCPPRRPGVILQPIPPQYPRHAV
uniref:WSSV108 n=1 Tax=White spot syndrome virus TaxID=342409 RepID=A0A3G5BHU0_9VIRU|nr:WSSV108 [White spot syndrome virus]